MSYLKKTWKGSPFMLSHPGRKSKYLKATSNGMLQIGKEQEKKDVEMNH